MIEFALLSLMTTIPAAGMKMFAPARTKNPSWSEHEDMGYSEVRYQLSLHEAPTTISYQYIALTSSDPSSEPFLTPARPDCISALERLSTFSQLEENWDGYNGRPASINSLRDAYSFLNLIPSSISVPRPTMSNSGEIGFFWRTDNCFIDLVFEGNETYSYYGKSNYGQEIFGNCIPIAAGLDPALVTLLEFKTFQANDLALAW